MINHKELFNTNVDESMKYPKHKRLSTNWTLDGYKTYDSEIYLERILVVILVFKLILHSLTHIPKFSQHFIRIASQRNKKNMSSNVR